MLRNIVSLLHRVEAEGKREYERNIIEYLQLAVPYPSHQVWSWHFPDSLVPVKMMKCGVGEKKERK